MLALILLSVLITQISASCSDISFSECDDFRSSSAILLAIQVPKEENCRKICQGFGDGCKFFTFEEGSYQANCQLYRQPLSTFLRHCNVLGGSKPAKPSELDQQDESICDYDKMEGIQVLYGQCDYGTVEERFDQSKWEYCRKQCTVLESCKSWRYIKEEGKCQILGVYEKKCQFKMALNTPELQTIGCIATTTKTTSTTTIPPLTGNIQMIKTTEFSPNCETVCKDNGLKCDENEIKSITLDPTCSTLLTHFPEKKCKKCLPEDSTNNFCFPGTVEWNEEGNVYYHTSFLSAGGFNCNTRPDYRVNSLCPCQKGPLRG